MLEMFVMLLDWGEWGPDLRYGPDRELNNGNEGSIVVKSMKYQIINENLNLLWIEWINKILKCWQNSRIP